MKTTKKLQRLHLEKNTTRYRKMSGGTQASTGNTPKSRFPMFSSIGKKPATHRQDLTNAQKNALDKMAVNRFKTTSKVFRGIGKKFGLYKETPKQRLIGAVDELVKEIKKFNDKTRNYAQYGFSDEEEAELKKAITSTFAGIPVDRVSKVSTLAESKDPVPSVSKGSTFAEFKIPVGAKPGTKIEATVNGKKVSLTVPSVAKPGEIIRFPVK